MTSLRIAKICVLVNVLPAPASIIVLRALLESMVQLVRQIVSLYVRTVVVIKTLAFVLPDVLFISFMIQSKYADHAQAGVSVAKILHTVLPAADQITGDQYARGIARVALTTVPKMQVACQNVLPIITANIA